MFASLCRTCHANAGFAGDKEAANRGFVNLLGNRDGKASLRVPLGISLFMHVAIIVLAIWRFTGPEKLIAPPQEALPVEIMDISEVSKRAAMRRDVKEPPKKVEKPAPPKEVHRQVRKPAPKPAREVQQAAREPAPAPEPKPQPQPEKKPEPEPAPKPSKEADAALDALVKKVAKAEEKPEPKPKKVARPKPKVKPRPRPKIVRRKPKPKPKRVAKRTPEKPKKKRDAIDEIAALLNKTDEERAAPQPKPARTGAPLKGPANINGGDARIAADLADALRARIEQCWNIPAGVRDAENLQVRVRFQLGPGGEVTGGPVVLNSMNHPAFPAAAQSAVRAVLACAPYAFLPPDRYDLWRDVILTFDPSRMLAVN